MTRTQRIVLLSLAAAILVIAIVVIGTGGNDDRPTPTTAVSTAAAPQTAGTTTPGATTTAAAPPPVDQGPLLVRGRIQKIKVHKGDQIRLRAQSSVADELHVHGYDLMRDLTPGKPVALSFKATIEGIFEIEFEDAKEQVGSLVVEP